MCINLPWTATEAGLTFGQLANVQTVGIGLYLALAIIQAVSTTGVAGLARRVTTLRNGVISGRMGPVEIANVRRLSFDVSGLEYSFSHLNRRLLWFVFAMFAFSLAYFAYCTIWQNVDALQGGVWFVFLFYLALPVAIFLVTTIIIARRCRVIAKRVQDMEKRILAKQLNLP